MNTIQIERALRHINDFDGCYSIDTLPAHPRLLICNTDPSDKPGEHWICIGVRDDIGEYFDSYGMSPNATLIRYMNSVCKHWTFNAKQLQSIISRVCAHYCIYYIVLKSKGFTMTDIVSSFSDDTSFNDCFVHAFVCLNINR